MLRAIRPRLAGILTALALALIPQAAHAGGTEFPADGVRGLGRGGTGMTRADDPNVMLRNPALLADLWDDQAMLGAHLLIVDSCFQPTGGYGWDVIGRDVGDFGEGPVYINNQPGDTDLEGNPINGYVNEPYPKVCYQGPAPFYPHTALTMKLADDLGVGVGFFPPELASLGQWGDRDGTIDTPNGRRPNPLRYLRSHLNVSYFSALAGVGYRLADWIRIGAGFQWQLAVFQARTWSLRTSFRDPSADVRTDAFGRDLFIPGVIASVHLVPIDPLDVAVGFKWSDRVSGKGKLDLTAGALGAGEVFHYLDTKGIEQTVAPVALPRTTHNQPGRIENPPIWVPQLSLGVRYADRLVPRSEDRRKALQLAGGAVEDSMATERWDIEAVAIVYFNSVYDNTDFYNQDARVLLDSVNADGSISNIVSRIGECLESGPSPAPGVEGPCMSERRVRTRYHGNDQISLRLGGDYNVIPGVLALRGGGSMETDGQDVEYTNPLNYMLRRYGLHAGLTWRIAGKTDVSIAFAHFFQRNVRLQVNDSMKDYPQRYRTADYHFAPGLGEEAAAGQDIPEGDFDGVAKIEAPYTPPGTKEDGPFFINAGSYTYHLDVVSLAFTQHF